MLVLKPCDVEEIVRMKQFGLLEDIDVSKLTTLRTPQCRICCSDGAQRKDSNEQLKKILDALQAEDMFHEFKDNGLPYKAVPSRIIDRQFNTHLSLLNSINEAFQMQKIDCAVINEGHYPCGIAFKNGLQLRDCVQLLVDSKHRIPRAIPGRNINFIITMQVDYSTAGIGKGKNTYHLDSSKWPSYAEMVSYSVGNLYSRSAAA